MQLGEHVVVLDTADAFRYTAHAVGRTIASERSHRQLIEVIELIRYGRSLWINGDIQLTEHDEYIYHQLLAFVALFYHPRPADILVIGGGELLLAWRVGMRYGVERIKIADWDKTIRTIVCDHLPWTADLNIQSDPRVDFEEELDVSAYLPTTSERFDAIFVDLTRSTTLTDLVPNAPERISEILKPGGVVAALGPNLSLAKEPLGELRAMVEAYRQHFRTIWVIGYPVESFLITQSILIAWKDREVRPYVWTWREFKKRFAMPEFQKDRRFYCPDIHRAAISMVQPEIKAALKLS